MVVVAQAWSKLPLPSNTSPPSHPHPPHSSPCTHVPARLHISHTHTTIPPTFSLISSRVSGCALSQTYEGSPVRQCRRKGRSGDSFARHVSLPFIVSSLTLAWNLVCYPSCAPLMACCPHSFNRRLIQCAVLQPPPPFLPPPSFVLSSMSHFSPTLCLSLSLSLSPDAPRIQRRTTEARVGTRTLGSYTKHGSWSEVQLSERQSKKIREKQKRKIRSTARRTSW